MNKINQFLNSWESRFGWNSIKEGSKIGVAATVIPIISAAFGALALVDTIKNRKTANKVEFAFAIDILAEVMMVLGLGILIILSALLISLGKNLKQACCSSDSKSQIIKD